jgi:uncharacterized repeat protein (TIGR03803 family)
MSQLSISKIVCIEFIFCVAATIAAPAQTFSTLVNFDWVNGADPGVKPLAQGPDGNFYGTTSTGGANGRGTAFRMTPAGELTTLYDFCGLTNCADGAGPAAGLVLGANGVLYGTTDGGGAKGGGTFFKITLSGLLTTLASFDFTTGIAPNGALIQGPDRRFYGTTILGGNLSACSGSGCGTIFSITPGGTLKVLYNFCSQPNCIDGAVAFDGLAFGEDGNLYGGTWRGGTSDLGTIYRITPDGHFTTLYSFAPGSDGYNPLWLTLGSDGTFFGTTYSGGNYGAGTVFSVTDGGTETTLYSFCSLSPGCIDGAGPRSGLERGTDGNFYGGTYFGGANNLGTVFSVTPQGVLTTLHSFDGADGEYPITSILQATNGTFYGTTAYGGGNSDGTIFSLTAGLGPFVRIDPGFGTVGTSVIILGNELMGATEVTFNGTPAEFTVISASEIKAVIPAGATTGFVTVTTPGNTLESNLPFLVR